MYAVIRLRGSIGVPRKIEDTLRMLRLKRVNHCVLLPETDSFKGMLQVAKDYITWGEINKETLVELLKVKLRTKENKRVDEKVLKEITGYDNFESFAEDLIKGKVKIKNFEELNPVFRLHPPRKGFKSIKTHWPKGDLGYRGDAINELIKRMI
ncbi:MAG: 50S ribosomal protein L30 [Candidatus Aenigmarchaeota archaeon]|nr:50S ribosomal protein L30 [Candidatus Aenigmarchaeota archaeon]